MTWSLIFLIIVLDKKILFKETFITTINFLFFIILVCTANLTNPVFSQVNIYKGTDNQSLNKYERIGVIETFLTSLTQGLKITEKEGNELRSKVKKIDKDLEVVRNTKVKELETKFENISNQFDQIGLKLSSITKKLDENLEKINKSFDSIKEEEITLIKKDIQFLGKRVKNLETSSSK